MLTIGYSTKRCKRDLKQSLDEDSLTSFPKEDDEGHMKKDFEEDEDKTNKELDGNLEQTSQDNSTVYSSG